MTPARGRAVRISRVGLNVPDLDIAERFYRDALGFRAVERDAPDAGGLAALLGLPGTTVESRLMRLGDQEVELTRVDPPGAPYPADSTATDLWFQHCAIVVGDIATATAHVARFAEAPITTGGPQKLPPNTGAVSAYKFRDPFGHPLELLHFPHGVGDPTWHRPGMPPLFRGIDHTAIAVGDVQTSARFYEENFGLVATGRSVNSGVAQSRLDGVAADRVDVVALAPARPPPHLELLGYHAGRRRPRPQDWRASDIAMTRTVLEAEDVASLSASLAKTGGAWRTGAWQGRDALCGTDPDGHVLIIVAV